MANFNDIELEKLSELYKKSQRKANALGADGDIFDEPFGLEQTIKMSDLYGGIRISDNFASPKYADYPSVGTIGTRRVKVRLHPLVGSGVGGNDSIQTFVCVHRAPASDSIDDIEAVRLKKLIPPDFSPRRKSAAEATTTVRGFAIALYPAEEVSGVLEAYESNGPIPYGVDPGSAYGMGNGKWFIDYANGIVRFSVSPLNGSAGLMNPNNVYGDLNGNSISASSGGRITMFATFYVYEPRAIIPEYDGYDLGSTTNKWNNIYTENLYATNGYIGSDPIVSYQQASDGYVAFFIGSEGKIAGDNDLYWNREENRLEVGSISATNIDGDPVVSSQQASDGYVAFFVGNDGKVAGDNDLYWNREENRLEIGKDLIIDGYTQANIVNCGVMGLSGPTMMASNASIQIGENYRDWFDGYGIISTHNDLSGNEAAQGICTDGLGTFVIITVENNPVGSGVYNLSVYTSTDYGLSWQSTLYLSSLTAQGFLSLDVRYNCHYIANKFFILTTLHEQIIGYGDAFGGSIYTSSDGISWQQVLYIDADTSLL